MLSQESQSRLEPWTLTHSLSFLFSLSSPHLWLISSFSSTYQLSFVFILFAHRKCFFASTPFLTSYPPGLDQRQRAALDCLITAIHDDGLQLTLAKDLHKAAVRDEGLAVRSPLAPRKRGTLSICRFPGYLRVQGMDPRSGHRE